MKYLTGMEGKLILGILAMVLFLVPVAALAATENIEYTYYDSGAVWKVKYIDKAQIEYTYDNSGNMTTRTVAMLNPDISASPSSLGFGNIHVGETSAPQTITITNTGSASLIISTVTKSGADAAHFAIQSDTCTNSTIAPAATCQISVTFNPVSGGSKNAAIVVASNDPDTPNLNVPINGNGAFLVTIVKNGTASGTVTGPGIDCGADCTELYVSGTPIALTSSTTGHTCSTFAGWAGGGCSSSCTPTINADTTITATFNVPSPIASFTPVPVCGKHPLTVNFTDNSICATSRSWTFGDGQTSTSQTPTHLYDQPIPPGQFETLYTVSLTVNNISGNDTMSYSYIKVQCVNDPVRNVQTGQQFTAIQAAYNAAASGQTIQVQAMTITEDLTFNQAKTVTIDGGYKCDYTSKIGNTTLRGNVTDSNGSVTMGSIVISQ